jgi:hypothetical protein
MEMSEVSRNDITGDAIKTKVNTNQNKFDKGFDGIDWSVKLEPEKSKENKDESLHKQL